MSKQTGGPAFPVDVDGRSYHPGQTLRDHFAGLALNGDASHRPFHHEATDEQIARYASLYYRIADAMLKSREQ